MNAASESSEDSLPAAETPWGFLLLSQHDARCRRPTDPIRAAESVANEPCLVLLNRQPAQGASSIVRVRAYRWKATVNALLMLPRELCSRVRLNIIVTETALDHGDDDASRDRRSGLFQNIGWSTWLLVRVFLSCCDYWCTDMPVRGRRPPTSSARTEVHGERAWR
jgi:hypothetical protein